jgi:4-hydroxy-tetrahydrodipicolinate reductase
MRVALYGRGGVNRNVSGVLARRGGFEVLGPYGRDQRDLALASDADAVVIATTSFLTEVAPDIETAIEHGSNVLTTCEEAAYPWTAHGEIAEHLDDLARRRGVSVLGGGVNPGFAFDALVLTATGACWDVESIRVQRVVNLSGFSEAIIARLGIGVRGEQFDGLVASGTITGHIGFPQSMRVVAGALGVSIERIERQIEPIIGERDYERPAGRTERGLTAGFRQHYTAISEGRPWFEAVFTGHLDPGDVGRAPLDRIEILGSTPVSMEISPGLNPQLASSAMVANSLVRLVAARPGWITVADLPPASPAAPRPR